MLFFPWEAGLVLKSAIWPVLQLMSFSALLLCKWIFFCCLDLNYCELWLWTNPFLSLTKMKYIKCMLHCHATPAKVSPQLGNPSQSNLDATEPSSSPFLWKVKFDLFILKLQLHSAVPPFSFPHEELFLQLMGFIVNWPPRPEENTSPPQSKQQVFGFILFQNCPCQVRHESYGDEIFCKSAVMMWSINTFLMSLNVQLLQMFGSF